jgi:creatinine amidohydrolase/Fe(II)-dependent formamide hydrolase-like protein
MRILIKATARKPIKQDGYITVSRAANTRRVTELVDCVCPPPIAFGFALQWMDYADTMTLRRSTPDCHRA